MNYTEAIQELEEIVQEIETGKISVDDLSEKVSRAAELTNHCKGILKKTEVDVEQILKELNDD